MDFLLRFSTLALITFCILRFAPDKWVKHNTLLMIGYLAIAGILFAI